MSLLASLLNREVLEPTPVQKKQTYAELHNWRNARATGVPATNEFYLGLLKNGPLKGSEIARLANRKQPAATKKMYHLERKGLVKRNADFKRGQGYAITWELV